MTFSSLTTFGSMVSGLLFVYVAADRGFGLTWASSVDMVVGEDAKWPSSLSPGISMPIACEEVACDRD